MAIREITKRLPEADFDLITARLNPNYSRFEKVGNVGVYRVGFGFSLDKFLLPFLGCIRALILHRRHSYDAVWGVMASYGSIAAAFFKIWRWRIPMVLTLQEGDEEKHLKRYVLGNDFLYRILIKPWYVLPLCKADFITVISKHLENRARAAGVSAPIEIIPNGVDIEKFSQNFTAEEKNALRARFGFKPEDVLVISVSRLVKKNGLIDLVKAAVLLPPDYKVLVVGAGPLKEKLEKEIFELGLSGRVVLSGPAPIDEIPLFMKAADVFVRPSLSEGFGNVFTEAFAAGLPVVATPVGGIPDFLEDKKTGIFCGVSDPTDIALKVGMAVKDKELRHAIINNAKEIVREKYSWDKIAKSMDGVFRRLANPSRRSMVIATGIYPPQIGGPAEYAKNLHEALTSMGHEAKVVKYGVERLLPPVLRHILFFFKNLLALPGRDFVLALDNFSAAVPAIAAAKILGKKSIVRVGGDFLWEKYVERTGEMVSLPDFNKKLPALNMEEKIIFRLIKWLFKKTDFVVFSTKWLSEIFSDSYLIPKTKIRVVENFYGPKLLYRESVKKNFVWAGRNIKLKNLETIEAAFAEAKVGAPDIELEVVKYPHEILLEKIKNSYAVISVSLSEVSPNFIIESLYCNKPFIATNHCGIKDRLNGVGVYADPLDRTDIARKITYLADKENYVKELKKISAFDFTHSWTDIADEFLSIIKEK